MNDDNADPLGDNADPLGDTTAGSVEPAMQTKEEEAEQEDTEPTQSL